MSSTITGKTYSKTPFHNFFGRVFLWVIFIFTLFVSSWNVVGQNPEMIIPEYQWLENKTLPTVNVKIIPPSVNSEDITISIATDPEGNVYLLTFGKGVAKRDNSGNLINPNFIPASALDSPLDIAIDENGFIYIADYFAGGETFEDNGKIWVFSPEGTLINSRTIFTSFYRPLGVDVDEENVYVAEFNDGNSGPESNQLSRIRIYDKNSGVPGLITADVNTPYRIAVDSQKNIYVSQAGNGSPSVRIYNQDLIFQDITLPNILSPGSIVIDSFDFIHVIEYDGRIDFSQFINFEELTIQQIQAIAKKIDEGQKANAFSIKVFNPNRELKITIKDQIDFPIDLTFNNCDKMYVNNAKIFGSPNFILGYVPDRLEFDLEIYKRTPSFDLIKPLLNCPADITVTAAAGATSKEVNYTVPIPTDNCSTPVLTRNGPATGSSFRLGETTIIYTAEDAAGNVETCSFTITVNPNDSETTPIPVLKDDTYPVNAYEVLIADNNPIDGILENDTYTSGFQIEIIDEVGFGVLNLNSDGTFVYTPNDAISRTGGTDRFTYRLINADGVVSEIPGIVIITVIQLTIECPANSELQVDLNGQCEVPLPDFTGLVSTNNPNAVITQSPLEGTPISEDTLITFTATVNERGSVFCERLVEVINRKVLDFNCPSTQIEEIAAADGNFEIPDYTALVDVTSYCGIENIVQNPPRGTIISSSQTIVFTISDDFEVKECEIELILTQPDPPFNINCVSNYLVKLEGNNIVIPTAEFVEGDLSNIEFTVAEQSFTCADIGINSITIEATNLNTGETDSCIVEVTVEDTTAPVVSCLVTPYTITLAPDESRTITGEELDTGSSDNCGNVSFSLSQSTFTASDEGSNTIILTVTDENNNSSTCSVLVQVEVEDPQAAFECKEFFTIQLDANGQATLSAGDLYTGDGTGTQFSLSKSTFTCADVGVQTITLSYTGAETGSCPLEVTVGDIIAPVISCLVVPYEITLAPDESRTITGEELDTGSFDNCGNVSFSLSQSTFTASDDGSNTITLTVTDENNNSSTCSVLVQVEVEDPQAAFECKEFFTIQLDANGQATLSSGDLYTGDPGDREFTLNTSSFDCTNIGENPVVLNYTGNDGSGSCTINVTIEDALPPEIQTQNISISLDSFGFATITPEMVDNGTIDNCGIPEFSLDLLDFSCENLGINTVLFTAIDANGNSATQTVNVDVTGNCKQISIPPIEYIFIYPNPTPGPFTFEAPTGWIIEKVDVFDYRGRYITTAEFPMGEPYNMDLGTLQTAVYTLHLTTNQGNKIIRVIIE